MIPPPKAYENISFLNSSHCRPIRLQLEYLHPEVTMMEQGVKSTIVIFGSARIPSPETVENCKNKKLAGLVSYYEEARKLSEIVSTTCQTNHECEYVVVTGGGGGIMEAGNRGAFENQCKSISLNIMLPFEQEANPYVTPELNFEFRYFHMRKMHFLLRAKATVIFPGGFGTFDELFEVLTLIQTRKIQRMPVILFDEAHWKKLVNWEYLAECGLISPDDLELLYFCDKAEDAWKVITDYYA